MCGYEGGRPRARHANVSVHSNENERGEYANYMTTQLFRGRQKNCILILFHFIKFYFLLSTFPTKITIDCIISRLKHSL